MKNDVKFEYVPHKKCLIFFHFHCFCSFSLQNWELLILKVIEILRYFFIKKNDVRFEYFLPKWLICFKLCCLSRILAVSWEIQILNFIETVSPFHTKGTLWCSISLNACNPSNISYYVLISIYIKKASANCLLFHQKSQLISIFFYFCAFPHWLFSRFADF